MPYKHLTAYLLALAALVATADTAGAQQKLRPTAGSAAYIQSDNDSIWLVGQVMDLDAQAPIAYARVEIDGHPAVQANSEGKFFVRGTRRTKKTVDVRAMGYEPHTASLSGDGRNGSTDVWMIRASKGSKRRGAVQQLPRPKAPTAVASTSTIN